MTFTALSKTNTHPAENPHALLRILLHYDSFVNRNRQVEPIQYGNEKFLVSK